MKRVGQLMTAVIEPDNLRLAFWKAARGKADRAEVQRYRANLEAELTRLRLGLLDGTYPIGRYRRFVVHDPKRRTIHAPAFAERVLHHALMNVCEPCFERWAVQDSYACRKGKGQWAAVRRAEGFARRAPFFLKLDIRKYFDSVPHERLLAQLARHIKDSAILSWFGRLLASYQASPGRGLPIGSLTSQHLANFYLGRLDRFVKERLRCAAYVRYMDDFCVWGERSAELAAVRREIEAFLAEVLGLSPKPTPYVNRTERGMDFLGCRVFPGYSTLNSRSRRRFRRKLARYESRFEAGQWDEDCLQRHVQTLVAFTRQVSAFRFRQQVLEALGQRSIGLEPREPRGQLEQQRAELPVSEPEQEPPVEHEPQPRVPRRPSSGQRPEAEEN
ncbi:MAG: group II intron reverse transcriptase domain-containing protein [Verrucomicrobia bacterium]|nr:group II intron reverse transcriptase domain-containing protein [Verrucomicrobiota bacterium]